MRKKYPLRVSGLMLLVILTFIVPSNLSAQNFIEIKGVVKSDSAFLPNVSVTVKADPKIGVITDLNGNYSIKVASRDAVLMFSLIGYTSQNIPVNGRSNIDILLVQDAKALGEVFVTALGIGKGANTLTYATQNLSGSEILKVKDVNFINSLAGKVAGAVITPGTMGPGSATRVLIRGDKSFTGNSAPLWVIDGVPTTRGDLLNPEDIESIQVLQASAAALYGGQSANGVILITTKKGRNGVPKITFSSNLTMEEASDLPKLQTKYGRTVPNFNDCWGAQVANGSDRHLKEFWKTGLTKINAISFSNGNDIAQIYMSYSNTSAIGILPENDLSKHNFNIKITTKLLNDKLSLEGSVNYIIQKIYNQNVIGGYSAIPGIISFPIDDDWSKYSGNNFEVWDPLRSMYVQNYPYIRNETFPTQNPYWVQKRNQTDDFLNYSISSFRATYKILNWLNIQGRINYEDSYSHFERRDYASTISIVEGANGGYGISNSKSDNLYSDLLLTGSKKVSQDINVSGILGFSDNESTYSNLSLSTTPSLTLQFPNYFSVYALNGLFNKSESLRKTESQALFANATIGYKDKVFLDITGRKEWSSTVFQSFFYPSFGLAYILKKSGNGLLSFVKVRASYAEIGNSLPFSIADLNPPYALDNGGNIVGKSTLPYFNGTDTSRLKPERSNSYEIGTDLRFFDNKLSLNLTFYSATTSNQVFQIQAPAGSGAANFWINGGSIRNQGFEGVLSYNASFGNIEWTPSVTFSHNQNQIRELSDLLNADRYVLSDYNSTRLVALFLTRPKDGKYGSYGDMYGNVYVKDKNGVILTNSAGFPILSPNPDQFIGNANPNFLAGFDNTFTYKSLSLSFLIDGRFGGGVVNKSELWLDYKGLSKRTGDSRDAGGVMFNGKLLDAKTFYLNQTGAGSLAAMDQYFYDATNIRMREISLGYTFSKFSKFFKSIDISLVGRNLFLLYKNAPFDPEIGGSVDQTSEGMASFTLPATRSFGLNVRAVF